MPKTARSLPTYLADRYRGWRAVRFEENRHWYQRLAEEGQRPRAMVVTCCDSRVDVAALFGAEPGDLFLVRNVANLVPPYEPDHMRHGTSAAVEYAVLALKVSHILVLGHSHCGGVEACLGMCSGEAAELMAETTFVGRWMSLLSPAYDRVAAAHETREHRLRALEHESVLTSLRNLETFPFVRAAVEEGRLTLHGGWIDIADGTLHMFSTDDRQFHPLDPRRT
jgi:carbonic anhydrase